MVLVQPFGFSKIVIVTVSLTFKYALQERKWWL